MNTLLFLDYDRPGLAYPVLPFQVNCYGSRVIRNRGVLGRIYSLTRIPRALRPNAVWKRVLLRSEPYRIPPGAWP